MIPVGMREHDVENTSGEAGETNDGNSMFTFAEASTGDIPPLPETSPAVSTPHAMTFNQAVFTSLQTHPTIGAALETIRQTQGDYLQSTLPPNPTVYTDIQMLPFGRPFKPTKQGGPTQQDVFVTYPIDWFLFGKRAAAMAVTHYGIHVSQADFQDLIRQRILETSIAFFDLVEMRNLLQVAQANLENLASVEHSTQLAVEAGRRPPVELNRVRLDVLSARQDVRVLGANAAAAEAVLRSVTGLTDPTAPLDVTWDLSTPLKSDPMDVQAAISVAEQERPDLQSLRWQVTQAGADIKLQQRLAWPELAPSLGFTYQYQKEMENPNASSYDAALNVGVPLFNRNQGNIAKAEAAQRQAQYLYAAKVLTVRAEVQSSIAELRAMEENARAVAEEQLTLAAKTRDSIVEAYGLGARPLIDVLDAQRNYRETFRLYINTRTAYWKAWYRFHAAIGAQSIDHE